MSEQALERGDVSGGLDEAERTALAVAVHDTDAAGCACESVYAAVERILADRLAAAECGICADHARVEALIQRSSLGTAEATAVRESVPNDIGIALATAARYLARAESAEADAAAARAELAKVRERANPFVTISAALDAKRPDLAGTELQMWRRVTKVCEESGEVWRALSGYVAENPRKGQTHTLDDLRGELLDTASAALCAWAHLDGNTGADPVEALLDHVAATADRLRAALGGAQ